jgi:hypothetical protein
MCTGCVVAVLVVAGCGGGTAATVTTGGTVAAPSNPTPTVGPSAAGSAGSPDAIVFDVKGTIGGHAVEGRVADARFSVDCNGAGPDQILVVHWEGDAPANTPVQGEIDFKPGTWTLGSTTAQGSATIGLQGGKANDALVATTGTVTTDAGGGTIDGTFTGGADSLQVTGSWTCPPHAS